MSGDEGLRGQRVVVFGASSGVGLATGRVAQQLGAEVVLVARDAVKLRKAAEGFAKAPQVEAVDGRDAAGVDALFNRLGELHHLVIPAGVTTPGGEMAKTMTREAMRETFEGKFWVQVNVALAGLRKLQRGGSITFFSGGAAHRALRGMANVAAVNGALEALVPTLALELAPTRVNAISPGTLDTPYWTAGAGHEVRFGVRDPKKLEALVKECGAGASAGAAGLKTRAPWLRRASVGPICPCLKRRASSLKKH